TFTDDNRGGKKTDSFYDTYPDIEIEARAFAIQGCSQKSSHFTATHLARFIDEKFCEITQSKKTEEGLIRSVESCRLDLRKWGANFQANSQRPYFEGHERQDVVAHRTDFISYFIDRKDHYYTVNEGDNPVWQAPTAKPCVLLFHDESTFRSGEVSAKRWIMPDHSPFYSKGRGRSYMVSDFLVAHYTGPYFALTHSEFQEAVTVYPELEEDKEQMFKTYSATAGITIGQDAYFNNETVLFQFERLFQLVKYKTEFKDHDIEIVVDNARTHSAKEYSINDFGKGIDTRCPVKFLEFIDEKGEQIKIPCHFTKGENKGKSKGLEVLAKELLKDKFPTGK
ncbi:unnamed protein product, partial [Didymodactylos carnosus]